MDAPLKNTMFVLRCCFLPQDCLTIALLMQPAPLPQDPRQQMVACQELLLLAEGAP